MTTELTAVDRVSDDTARARLERLLYSSVGAAAVVYTAVLFPGAGGIGRQMPQLATWYALTLVAVAIVLPAALGVLTWLVPRPVMRRIAVTTALVFLVGMAFFPLGLRGETLEENATPWYQGIHALHGMILATAWQSKSIWLYGIGQGVVIGTVQAVVREDAAKASLLDGVGSFVFIVILMAAATGVIGAADRLDFASRQARSQAARTAASRTREREETRINAMVHDDIMSVLLTAARDNPPPSLSDQARVAINAIEQLETRDATSREYTVAEVVRTLVEIVGHIAPATDVSISTEAELAIPAEAVTALNDALAEALRNSVRHAGADSDDVPRAVEIVANSRGLTVAVRDRGRGFNTRAVASRRLGIRLSIIERMALVTGGHADVHSRPGLGTDVILRWECDA